MKVNAKVSVRMGQPFREVRGISLPSSFRTYFLIPDEVELDKKWSLEFLIEVGELGTPKAIEVISKVHASTESGFREYEPITAITTRHFNFVYKNFKNLLLLSCDLAVSDQLRNLDLASIKEYKKDLISRTSKRKITPEFLAEVESKKTEFQKRLKIDGERDTSNELLADYFEVSSVKTVEAWLAKIPSKKVSATKAGKKHRAER
jgi:hypothetical protein